MKRNQEIMIAVAILVLCSGAAFYGGMLFGKSQGRGGNFSGAGRQFAAGTQKTGNKSGMMTVGEIIAKDDKSVTLKMRDGGSKIVFFSASTEVGKMATGTVSDLTVGTSVTLTGAANADGSVTASMIQIRPSGTPAFGAGNRGSAASSQPMDGQQPGGAPAPNAGQ